MHRAPNEDSSEQQVGAWYAVHHGFEVQIQDSGDERHRTGSIYSLAQADLWPKLTTAAGALLWVAH